jgi:hypothetical protein
MRNSHWMIAGAGALLAGYVFGCVVFPSSSMEAETETGAQVDPKETLAFAAQGFEGNVDSLLSRLRRVMISGGDLKSILGESEDIGEPERSSLLLEFMMEQDVAGLEKLLEHADDVGDDGVFLIALVERFVSLDPDRFFEVSVEDAGNWNFKPMIGLIFLASIDPGAAMERIKGSEDEDESKFVAIGLAIHSTADGIRWMRELGDENADYGELLNLELRDPIPALGEILKIESLEARDATLEALFGKWAKTDPHAAIAAAASSPNREANLKGIFEIWGARDPSAAMLKTTDQAQKIAVLKGWAAQDSAAALEWARENLSESALGLFYVEAQPDLRPSEFHSIFTNAPGLILSETIMPSDSDPILASTLVDPESTFEAARNRGDATGELNKIVETWLQHDDTRYVFDWVKDDFANTPEIQQTMVNAWIDRDPAEGADLLKANQMEGVLDLLMEKWNAVDPDGARVYSEK